ncbi:MAG: hypothetical protein AB1630_12670 [bacterium]
MDKEALGLAPFLKEVEEKIDNLSKEEIKSILLAKAKNLKPIERGGFLDELSIKGEMEVKADDTLLADIDDFVSRIEKEEYVEDWNDYDERVYGDESWAEEMDDFFDYADELFLSGNFNLAASSYRKLLKVLENEDKLPCDEYSPEEMLKTDINEAKTRYFRALYEITDKDKRARTIFEEMENLRYIGSLTFNLKQLEDALLFRPMDWNQFLIDLKGVLLKDILSKKENEDYTKNFDILCEIIFSLEKEEGLAIFAKEYGNKFHKIYLVLISKLQEAKRDKEVIGVYQQALKVIPHKIPIRAEISDLATKSAEEIKDKELVFEMCKEAFFSSPNTERILILRASAKDLGRLSVMEETIGFLESHQGQKYFIHYPKKLLVQSYILTENYDKMWKVASKEEPLGWSWGDNSQALAIPFLILSSVRGMSLRSNSVIRKIWEKVDDFGNKKEEEKLKDIIEKEILTKEISKEERISHIEWAKEAIEKRVDAIVLNKHRGSYDKAALLLVGCVEALNLLDRDTEADSFLDKIKSRYNRHIAFQREITELFK